MPIALFFNTDYFNEVFDDSTVAAARFSDTVLGLKSAINKGADNYLVSAANALTTLLAFDYSIMDWISDRRVENSIPIIDRDLQRYFASKLNKAPFREESFYHDNDDFLENEVEVDSQEENRVNHSATLTILNSGILVSPPLSVFAEPFVKCFVNHIEEPRYEASLRCISGQESFETHSSHISNTAGFAINSSIDIWNHREKLFPNLEFCERIQVQLQQIDRYSVVLERIMELENYAKYWHSGPFEFGAIPSKVSPESEQVRNNQRALDDRTFLCPDGERRQFFWHLRATPGAMRVYFYPMEHHQDRKIIIGHIGAKPYYP